MYFCEHEAFDKIIFYPIILLFFLKKMNTIRAFPQFPHLDAGFVGAPDDFSCADGNTIKTIFPNIQWSRYLQIHGTDVIDAMSDATQADGSYTQEYNIGCHVRMGDCIGVLLYDEKTDEIAAVHAGWKGLAQKICTKYLAKFEDTSHVHAALSPSIGVCCCEFTDPFTQTPEFFHPFIHQKSQKYFVDLWSVAKAELMECGIAEENISMPNICTKCHSDWWSHRRGESQRNTAYIYKIKNQ